MGINVGKVYDLSAAEFFNATQTLTPIQKQAVNDLVKDLKNYNLWDKMKAIYPFVGETSGSHKFNLRNPSTYTITWTGTVQHDSTGIEFLGGYGDTGFAPFTALTNATQSNHISLYNNKTTLSSGNWGLVTTGNTTFMQNGLGIAVDYASVGQTRFNAYDELPNVVSSGTYPAARLGLFVATRTALAQSGYYQRGNRTVNASSTSSPSASPKTSTIYLGGENGNWGAENGAMAFASIGDGLTQTNVDDLYTAVQRFQTTLGRQV